MDNNIIYVVLSVDNSELEVCEIYNDPQIATYHALKLAKNKCINKVNFDWVNASPGAERLEDGTVRWTFLETSKHLVVLLLKSVLNAIPTLSDVKNSVLNTPKVTPVPTPVSTPKDDPYEKSLPGGFTYEGKPVNMGYVMDHPDEIVPPFEMMKTQQVALVIARFRKLPNLLRYVAVYGMFNQMTALQEIKSNGCYAEQLINLELRLLESFIEDLLDGVHP